MNTEQTEKNINAEWEKWFIPGLSDFIREKNLTPMVDPDYLTNGLIQQCYEQVDKCIDQLEIKGLKKYKYASEAGLPLYTYVVEGSEGVDKNVMVYGHLDKQPYGTGWNEDTPPTEPVIKDGCLFGRGGGDDGYAPFSCMLAIKNAQLQGAKMPRVCLVLETEEESGSPNLITLLKLASDSIGTPDFCFCMDSGAFDYNQLWMTSSLRGICIVDMTVEIGKNGYHSGEVGGIVPETFRVVRTLLDRLDDSATGKVMKELETEIPEWKQKEAEVMAKLAGEEIYTKYGLVDGAKCCKTDDLKELLLDNQFRANLSITGADGLPPIQMAGNVVRPSTSVRISMRLPPNMDPAVAKAAIEKKLTTDVPYGAKVTLKGDHTGQGWCMKDLSPALDKSIRQAGADFYNGKPTGSYGMGGSIPFLAELGIMYPKTEIVAFGVLGPNSNAHGPNEMIHLDFTRRLTCSLSHIIQGVAN